jgi:hypothetical protein
VYPSARALKTSEAMNSHLESNRHFTCPLTVVVELKKNRVIPKYAIARAESDKMTAGKKRRGADKKLHRMANTHATMLPTQEPARTP